MNEARLSEGSDWYKRFPQKSVGVLPVPDYQYVFVLTSLSVAVNSRIKGHLMRPQVGSAILAVILFLLVPALARADSTYTFDGSTVPLTVIPSTYSWSFDVSSILTTTTTITSLLSESTTGVLNTDGCTIASVEVISPSTSLELATSFSGCPLTTITLVFGLPFAQVGTLTDNSDTLTISSATLTSTPEPSSLVLLGFGLLALVGVAKFRLFA